jgi:NTP pyrophosphatase (non-canonical NTP hydrolase)
MAGNVFQRRVAEWLAACFPSSACADRTERMHRFLEEALELAQAAGCTGEDAQRLVDYVFSRDVGRLEHEVGGVMVTLAGLCAAAGINMNEAADRELERNWSRIDAIRHKRANKPAGSPLPQ